MLSKSSDTGSSLSLALGSRLAIKALATLQDQAAPNSALKAALDDVVTSLEAISTGGPLFGHLTTPSSFEHYDQIQVLADVNSAFGDDHLADKLHSVVLVGGDPAERQRNIDLAIDFFTALETRALRKYNEAAAPSF